jgi:hypothetical protein
LPQRSRTAAPKQRCTYILIYSLKILHPRSSRPKWCPQFQQDFNLTTDATGVFNSTLTRDVPVPVNATIDQLDNIPLSEVQGFKEPALPWYADQVLPFDINVACANEYGAAASAKLFGVEILNEGFGASVDDSVLEAPRKLRNVGNTWFPTCGGLLATHPNQCRNCSLSRG